MKEGYEKYLDLVLAILLVCMIMEFASDFFGVSLW